MNKKELKSFLDDKARAFEYPQFLEQDPIQIPHRFNKKEDIEIAGFLIATIAWGNRVSIIKSGNRMMDLMDNDPHHFVMEHNEADLKPLKEFVHRTFNGIDFISLSQYICTMSSLGQQTDCNEVDLDFKGILPSNITSISEIKDSPKRLVKVLDLLGRETKIKNNMLLIYQYSDGSSEKIFKIGE